MSLHPLNPNVFLTGAGASVPFGLPSAKPLKWDIFEELGTEYVAAKRALLDSFDYEAAINKLEPGSPDYLAVMSILLKLF